MSLQGQRFLLDSSACIEVLRDRSRAALRRLGPLKNGQAVVSTIVLAELEAGVELSTKREANRLLLEDFLRVVDVAPWTAEAASRYGRIRAALQPAGKMIGPMDMLIAAHALALDLPLITGNLGEFRRVPGLEVIPISVR